MEFPSTDAAAVSRVLAETSAIIPSITCKRKAGCTCRWKCLVHVRQTGRLHESLCVSIAGATDGSGDDYGTAGQRPDRAAHSPGFSAPEAARGKGNYPGRRRIHNPGLGVQDQPDGTG